MFKQKDVLIILSLILIPIALISLTVWFYYSSHNILPDASKWCIWDCGWYNGMREHGYIYKPNQQNNLAFFPLFPLTWKTLGVGNIGMCLINYLIFMGSAWVLIKQFKIELHTVLVFLCVGLISFFMIPYTESFFFLGSLLLLLGFNNHNYLLLTLGAFVAIGTRSASMIFLVSFVSMLLLEIIQGKKFAEYKIILYAILTVVIVNLLVFYYQYTITDNFWGFFEAHKYWDHHLRWPKLVHVSWHKPISLTENFALIVGVFGKLILCTYFFDIVMRKTRFKNPLAHVFKTDGDLAIHELLPCCIYQVEQRLFYCISRRA